MTAWHDVIENVQLVLCTVTIFVYLLVMFAIITDRSDQESMWKQGFFKIFVALGAADVANLFWMYIWRRFASWGWFDWFYLTQIGQGLLAAGVMAVYMALPVTQMFGVTLMAANRYTAICHPMRQMKIWTARNVLISIIVMFLIPTVYGATILSVPIRYYRYGNDSVIYLQYTESNHALLFAAAQIGWCALCLLVSSLLYTATVVQLVNHSRKMAQSRGEENKLNPAEIRLSLYGLLLFLTLLLIILHLIFFNLLFPSVLSGHAELVLFSILQDVFTGCNPYLLMVMSRQLRAKVKALLRCSNTNVQEPSVGADDANIVPNRAKVVHVVAVIVHNFE